jgi:chromosome segregation ATPase
MTTADTMPPTGERFESAKPGPPVARVPRLSPAGSRLSEKVIVTNQRLLEIQREEEDALLELLRENETLSRDTVLVEMEIRRLKQLREQIDGDRADYEREIRRLSAEREKMETARRDNELELQRLREGLATLKSEVASAMRQREELLRAHGELQNEIDRLHDQNERLGQDIDRLRDLKAEYLKSIAKYRESHSDEMGSGIRL